MIDPVVRCAGEEELQRPRDFLGHAVHEGQEHGGLVIFRQVAAALLELGLVGAETVLAGDLLRQLGAAESLVPVVEHLVVADHLHAGGEGAHLEQGPEQLQALHTLRRWEVII